ncbi:MAG: DUF3347 domain-containing protein [Algoriphagus sp.]|uniref:DUF3347 domain-containing protein n=1 Tax=Algoriphagus sp. TaxID=1872435 RepID=UPI002731AD7A|nr:DUF3347 domain-containing protein [Algoriphagus sp.]MDP2040388.1 DUF3347 domain-containing protein [Algoriphagus sp.]MDP3471077.1 DUF3347 domain-containing protein [Algoriphagus sp.]
MKKTLLFASLISFAVFSCGEKSTSKETHAEAHASSDATTAKAMAVKSSKSTTAIIEGYLAVKDALVADDQATASIKSVALVSDLKAYDIASSQANDPEELERLQVEATGFAEKLAAGDIAAQRESFQSLSVTMKEFLKIAGVDRTLYHQYCPMYKGNKGGMWLSANENIKNPLFGSSMLTCGRVEETLALN